MFYSPKHEETGRMWDTWLYWHNGTYCLYCLASRPDCQWDNISMATSPDGVHWTERGPVLKKEPRVTWMGTGSTWKSPDFAKDGKFQINFSWWIGPRQTIWFAESSDLLHWTPLGEKYEFVQDERWYQQNGRWDCIWTIPRPGGGLYGYWTASPKAETGGRFGFGETLDGVTWKALPPPKVEGAEKGEVGAIERIGDRYVMMYGQQSMMVALLADRPEGPFRPAKKNFRLLSGHTYFARFFPTPGGLLVNHHSIARRGDVYLGLLKTAVTDAEGTLRLGWWKGNDKLKEGARVVTPGKAAVQGNSSIAMIPESLKTDDGIILEGHLTLPEGKDGKPVGFFLPCTPSDGSAILVHAGGRCELGGMKNDGTEFKAEKTVDREMDFGLAPAFRLCLKRSLLEFYLNDILIECFSLPLRSTGRIGLISGDVPDAVRNLVVWSL